MDMKLILVRGFTSSLFRVFVLTGPTPKQIYTQIRSLSGKQYALNDYWQLGVHLCSEESNLTLAINDLNKLLDDKLYPFDSHCLQENLIWLTNKDIISSDTKTVIEKLRTNNKRFIASVVTPLEVGESSAYTKAKEQKILLTLPSTPSTNETTPYIGTAYNRNVSYIDFTLPEAQTWLNEFWSVDVINEIGADGYLFQGTWLPNTRPFVPIKHELPYVPDLMNDTMRYLPPWNVMTRGERFLLKQNKAPEAQVNAMVLNGAATKEKQMILTTTPSINVFGISYRQNVSSSWLDFGKHVRHLVGLSVGGYNLYGFPVCGDYGGVGKEKDEVNEELCIRWYQFASVMPIFRLSTSRYVDKFSQYGQMTLMDIIRR